MRDPACRAYARSGCAQRVDRRGLDEAEDRPRQIVVGRDEGVACSCVGTTNSASKGVSHPK
jgi:hypothetical protein